MSLSSGNIEWTPTSKCDQHNCFSDHVKKYDCVVNGCLCADVEFQAGSSESVSSAGDADIQMMPSKVVLENRKVTTQMDLMQKALQKTKFKLVCGLSFVLLAMATPLLWINSQDEGHCLVPT